MIKNPQVTAIIERLHAVLGNMLHTSQMDDTDMMSDTIDNFVKDAACTILATNHNILGSMPTSSIFRSDMLFDIPYLVDWEILGEHTQLQVDNCNKYENKQCIDDNYETGKKGLIHKDGVLHKAKSRYNSPHEITQVYTNENVWIECIRSMEQLNIRRIVP